MSGIPRRFKKGALDGSYPLLTDNIKAYLVDCTAVTSASLKSITGATNATPIVITATAHGFNNGDVVTIFGVGGNANANGLFKIANKATNTFELTNIYTGANIAGSGSYTSGGRVINLTTIDFATQIDVAARVATSGNLASKTTTNGVFVFANFTWTAVTGAACQIVVFYDSTPGADATNPIIAIDDGATNLPVTPNGGDIQYQINASGLFEI